MFEQEGDCEFIFVWRTLAACPIHKAEGKCSYLNFKISKHICTRSKYLVKLCLFHAL